MSGQNLEDLFVSYPNIDNGCIRLKRRIQKKSLEI